VIAAPPKAGKSMLMYQIAVEIVCPNGHVLGKDTETRPVLYFALEDSERRAHERISNLLKGRTHGLRNLTIATSAPALGGPLETEIDGWLTSHPRGVVIVDVLSKVRTIGRASGNAYDEDYASIAALHSVVKAHSGATVLLVTHDRKQGAEDWMTRVTGTRGVTGVADFVIFIQRARGETYGKIHVSGRDIEDNTYEVEFTGRGWQLADVQTQIGRLSPTRQTIFNWLIENGPAHQKEIAEGTGLTKDVVDQRVRDMAKDGQIVSVPAGYRAGD
jgi:RecA-family ATPase